MALSACHESKVGNFTTSVDDVDTIPGDLVVVWWLVVEVEVVLVIVVQVEVFEVEVEVEVVEVECVIFFT